MIDKYVADIKKESKKLVRRIKPLFQKFVGDKISSKCSIRTEVVQDCNEIYGTRIIEELMLYESANALVGLLIRREHFIDYPSEERGGADELYSIDLYWCDLDDHLNYKTNYYPDMDNDVIYNKTKTLLNSANLLFQCDVERKK